MDVNGEWVGLGLGDVSPTVSALKTFLVNKFSYALPLRASLILGGVAAQTYDQTMVDVVTQMQTAYGPNPEVNADLVVNGIMNDGWQIRSGFIAPPKITILTWQGTGVDMWDTDSPQPYGAAEYVAKACSNVVVQPVGNYPAAVVPMGASVNDGVNSAVSLLGGAPPISPGDPVYNTGKIVLWGYSQGAICLSKLWRDQILNPSGPLHSRVNDVIAAVTYGNPNRAPGIAHGNDAAGWGPSPLKDGVVTGGISGPDCLTAAQTPPWFYDYVWLGDDDGQTELYTANPGGPDVSTLAKMAAPGRVGTYIYDVVQDPTFGDVITVAEALLTPLAMVEEIYNGITFVVKGNVADHFAYDWQPSIEYVTEVCQTWTTNYITSGGAIA